MNGALPPAHDVQASRAGTQQCPGSPPGETEQRCLRSLAGSPGKAGAGKPGREQTMPTSRPVCGANRDDGRHWKPDPMQIKETRMHPFYKFYQHDPIAPAANTVDVPACIMMYSLQSAEHHRSESRSGKPRIVREENRIRFLLQRDGPAATTAWVRRTLHIYRAAVLDKNHFASSNGFRRRFIEAYCDFKRWLAMHAHEKSHGSA